MEAVQDHDHFLAHELTRVPAPDTHTHTRLDSRFVPLVTYGTFQAPDLGRSMECAGHVALQHTLHRHSSLDTSLKPVSNNAHFKSYIDILWLDAGGCESSLHTCATSACVTTRQAAHLVSRIDSQLLVCFFEFPIRVHDISRVPPRLCRGPRKAFQHALSRDRTLEPRDQSRRSLDADDAQGSCRSSRVECTPRAPRPPARSRFGTRVSSNIFWEEERGQKTGYRNRGRSSAREGTPRVPATSDVRQLSRSVTEIGPRRKKETFSSSFTRARRGKRDSIRDANQRTSRKFAEAMSCCNWLTSMNRNSCEGDRHKPEHK